MTDTASATVRQGKTGLLLAAGALLVASLTTPATAGFAQVSDASQLSARINQLENQVQTLSRALYRNNAGGVMPSAGAAGNDGSAALIAGYEDRLSQIEMQQRSLTGQLEQVSHELQQIKTRLDRTLADNEQRFQQLSSGAAASGGTPVLTGDLYATPQTRAGTSVSPQGQANTYRGGDPANTLYENAFSDIRAARYEAAETKLRQFMSQYASHQLAGNAQYWLAETYYVRGDYHEAAKMFAQGYQDYPQGQKAADCLLKLGLSLSRLGKKEDACLSLQQLRKQFPGEQSPVIQRANQEIKQLGCR